VAPFSIQFVSRDVRIRMKTGAQVKPTLLPDAGGRAAARQFWKYEKISGGTLYERAGSVTILENPGTRIPRRAGRLLTRTNHTATTRSRSTRPAVSLSAGPDYSRSVAAVFSLSPGEKLFGSANLHAPR